MQNMDIMQKGFSDLLIPEELLSEIQKDAKLVAKLQKTQIKDAQGKPVGTILDETGNLNPQASLQNYQKSWQTASKEIMKGGTGKNAFKAAVIDNLLKTVLRGDGITDPERAPNHLITINGIFPMSDDYFLPILLTINLQQQKC
jgi:hypothetical protein